MKKFKDISAAELSSQLSDDDFMLLDCREMKDYRAGHIENAMHLHEGLKESLLKNGDKGKKMIIYCYYGHASEHVAEMFCDFGFNDVFSLSGGYSSWKESLSA